MAGINHMAWFLRFERAGGENLYPALWRAMEDPAIYAKEPVRFEMMRHFGAFVTESSHHMSEYVPWFRRNPTEVEPLICRSAGTTSRSANSAAGRTTT